MHCTKESRNSSYSYLFICNRHLHQKILRKEMISLSIHVIVNSFCKRFFTCLINLQNKISVTNSQNSSIRNTTKKRILMMNHRYCLRNSTKLFNVHVQLDCTYMTGFQLVSSLADCAEYNKEIPLIFYTYSTQYVKFALK